MPNPFFDYAPPPAPTTPLTLPSGRAALYAAGFSALLLTGAIFGFFYAWVCSTMWGLDAAPPDIAVRAMQAMNASARNAVFAPAFFGTPLALALAAAIAWHLRRGRAAMAFVLAAAVYGCGAFALTLAGNVPMNEALAATGAPADAAEAARLWADFSPRWQLLNQIRTAASGVSLALAGLAVAWI